VSETVPVHLSVIFFFLFLIFFYVHVAWVPDFGSVDVGFVGSVVDVGGNWGNIADFEDGSDVDFDFVDFDFGYGGDFDESGGNGVDYDGGCDYGCGFDFGFDFDVGLDVVH
jgi:hypothetical protein